METSSKVTKLFSLPLMKQNIKSNIILIVVILIIMVMMSNVVNLAMSIMQTDSSGADVSEYQEEFYTYLGAMAAYNTMTGESLSYDDFAEAEDKTKYEMVFEQLSRQTDKNLTVSGLENAAEGLAAAEIEIDTYVKQFEYAYALNQSKGVFDGEELSPAGMMDTMLEIMGVPQDMVERMGTMDTTAMLNRMYFTVIGLLPIFILIVVMANSLLSNQVDSGSMAYVLSTPTKRFAVVLTQAVFMILVPLIMITIVCLSRIATTFIFYDEVNVSAIIARFAGMYILVEAVAGLCYLGSCLFSQSKKALAFGGGLATWFFLASLLGMFGSDTLLDMGVGVEELGIFNHLTLIGLYDIDALGTVGTEVVDTVFIWKLAVLAAIAILCYGIGIVRFQKKDLPL